MKDRTDTLGEVAWDVLQRMVRELLSRKPGGHLVEPDLRQIDLRLPLSLSDDGSQPQAFVRALRRSIDQALDDALQQAAAFRPGHAYCHRCESATCEHSQPPSCRHVFAGYLTTGMPRWEDFAQVCLELKHPDVDRLYEQPPALLTVIQEKAELHDVMLPAFRNGAYELLGQVTAGFFPLRARAEEGRGVLALTVQAAASRSRRGRPRFGLNLLGRSPSGEGLDMLWERYDELPWRRAVLWAQGALRSLSHVAMTGRPRADPAALDRRVAGILRGLARRLERDRRSRARRTRHAEQRHASGERPTRMAVRDARAANLDSCKIDERRQTLVVLGDRGRTHFFTLNGQLVSSVRYSKEAIARKMKLGLWRQATEGELDAFRGRLTGERR